MRRAFAVAFIVLYATHRILGAALATSVYSIQIPNLNAGGAHVYTSNYVSDTAIGEIGDLIHASDFQKVIRSGYVGKLYEATSFSAGVDTTNVDENTAHVLHAFETFDDGTVATGGSIASWKVLSGPILPIPPDGILMAANVFEDTPAQIEAVADGFSQPLTLLIKNTGDDDYGYYANDGIPDPWQVQYFGPNNPLGNGAADADHTGQNNYFKYIAGLNPTNPVSQFTVTISSVQNQPNLRKVTFSPRFADRLYTVVAATNPITGPFTPLITSSNFDVGPIRSVIDTNAITSQKYYRVIISLP